jgi:hypothetical protein
MYEITDRITLDVQRCAYENPILAKFLHETHYEENDDEGEWYMTDDNWRYFKEFVAEIMSDIEAAEAQVERRSGRNYT